ncbi:copper resistance protein CopC [Nocardia sp. NPDC052566]|uniref:copper resistance CopC/CopD family protein n=1 Tax=Nocardia sp. NPDC052566 TaxID=3364330 RepID=UPI0037CBCEF7
MTVRVLFGVFAFLAVGVVSAGPAAAHASMVATDPAYGAAVERAPERISVTFDETVTAAGSGVTVADREGKRVDTGEVRAADGGHTVVVGLEPGLPQGTYLLSWTVLSADGHTVGGSSVFGVGVPPDLLLAQAPRDPLIAAADTVVRLLAALGYLGIVLAVGVPAVAWAVWRPGLRTRAVVQLTRVGATTVGLTSLFVLAATPVRLAGAAGLADPQVWWQAATSTVGAAALIRVVAATVIACAGRWPKAVVAADIVVVLATAAAGHAMAGTDRVAALVSTTLHLVAMSVWVAGLVLAVLVWRRPDRVRLLAGFGKVAVGAIAVLALTGGYQSWRSVAPLDALWTTSWGRLLLLKLALILAACGAALLARRVSAALHVELAVQIGVLVATAILAGVAPARDTYDPAVTLTADAGPLRANITVDGAHAGTQRVTVRLRDSNGEPVGAAGLTGRLTRADGELGPIDIPFRRVDPIELGPNYFTADTVRIPLAGAWQLQLTVLADRTNGYAVTVPYRVW